MNISSKDLSATMKLPGASLQGGTSLPGRAIVTKPLRAKVGTGARAQAKRAWAKLTDIERQQILAKQAIRKARHQKHEQRFMAIWNDICDIPLSSQYRFHDTRQWRFDFAHPASKVAIETHGGTWVNGGHSRGKAFQHDREKMNEAQRIGWTVQELTGEMITADTLRGIAELIRERITDGKASP